MADTPSRLFALLLVLIGVWIATYWLYQPSSRPRVTTDGRVPMAAATSLNSPSGAPPDEPVVPVARPDLKPLPTAESDAGSAAAPVIAAPQTRRVQKVLPPVFREYVVQKGDVSWEAIAARKEVYGDRKLWSAVSRANPYVTPDRLKPGKTRLKIAADPDNIQGKLVWVEEPVLPTSPPAQPSAPSMASEFASAPSPVSPAPKPASTKTESDKTYTIVEDDTLWSISKKVYGQGAKWRKIYEANKDVIKDPDKPPRGAKIKIPPLASGEDSDR